MAKKKAEQAQAERKLRVTYVKSAIGRPIRQKKTVRALGFKHLNQTVTHPDNPSVRGMITAIIHLLRVEEVNE